MKCEVCDLETKSNVIYKNWPKDKCRLCHHVQGSSLTPFGIYMAHAKQLSYGNFKWREK